MADQIKARLIIEILGRPPEHLKEALNTLVVRMGSDKGLELLNTEYHKPKPVEKAENLWMAFAEIEAEFENFPYFFNTIMSYMPAHIEIHDPEKFKLRASEINELSNFIVSRLHRNEGILKQAMNEREILIRKLEYLRKGGKMAVVFGKPGEEHKKEIKREIPKKASKKKPVKKKSKTKKKAKK